MVAACINHTQYRKDTMLLEGAGGVSGPISCIEEVIDFLLSFSWEGNHGSTEWLSVPRELIRSVRQSKTAAEERNAITKESAALREAFKNQQTHHQHRNVAKLMYIHMMGYPTHFGQMECLKLVAAASFPEKRIGYLGLMILLDERQDVLMLVTNSLKNDLNSKNHFIVGLALAAMGNICSEEMARDLAPDIERLLKTKNGYIKKKATLCAIRCIKKVPELIESFQEPAAELLNDSHHGVLLGAVSLMLEMAIQEDRTIIHYRPYVPKLCKILKTLVVSGFAPDHDVGGINNPFLQVKILRLLRYLGKGSPEASDQMSDILAQVATNTEPTKNAGNSILYECVQTIMGVETISGLRVLAVSILGRFLGNRDNNMRYVALNTLAKIVSVDSQAVQRHRATVVECVKDADVSIRKRALELVYSLVNESNIKTLTRELLEYLSVSDAEFKPDLTGKICTLIQRFSPDKQWHIESMIEVLVGAGHHVKDEVCCALIVLITNAPDLYGYAVRSLYTVLQDDSTPKSTSLINVGTWCLGEYGDVLLPGNGGPLKEGESLVTVQESGIVDLLKSLLVHNETSREYILTALMKLSAKLPSQLDQIQDIVGNFRESPLLELQQRSCEYMNMFKYNEMRPQLLERMPALDEEEYARNLGVDVSPMAPAPLEGAVNGGTNLVDTPDLLGMDDLLGNTDVKTNSTTLDDLLGQAPVDSLPPANPGNALDLLDLLGDIDNQESVPSIPSAPKPMSYPSIVVYEGNGVQIAFDFEKPADMPHVTNISAKYVNTGSIPVEKFTVQVAVPKFMQLQLEPATGTTLLPNGQGSVTQNIHITNTQYEQEKLLAMRMKLSGQSAGNSISELCEVKNFPPGLR